MIIEAGCDLHELLHPRLIRDHEANGALGAPLSVLSLDDADRSVEARPELAVFDLLGQIAFDEDGYHSTLPRHSFRDLASRQDLS